MGDDLDAEIEVGCHASHDGELLIVLLAEHRDVRPCRSEQLRHHRGDAVEVTGPRTTLHRVAQPDDVDRRGEARRVHRRSGRDIHGIDAGRLAGQEIVVERARVLIEVSVLAELQWIDEDRHHDPVGVSASGIDQFEVTSVQSAHRGCERNGATGCAGRVCPGARSVRCVDHDGHPTNATSSTSTDLEDAALRSGTHRGTPVHRRSWLPPRRRGRRRLRTCRPLRAR